MYPKDFWNEFRIVNFPDKIFVGMSFRDKKYREREKIIKAAIGQSKLNPLILKDTITGDSIPIDIMKGIIESKLVLFDISPQDNEIKNRNENVMYEVGLAHTWRNKEEVIIIADDIKGLPFDIQSIGVMPYSINDEKEAIEKIKGLIEFRLQEIEKIFNAKVIRAATSLTMSTFKILMSTGGSIFATPKPEEFDINILNRLLDLGLVKFLTDAKPDGSGGYGYRVTDLGRAVIKHYGFPLSGDDFKTKYPSLYKMEYGIKD